MDEKTLEHAQEAEWRDEDYWERCPTCDGTGVAPDGKKCPDCDGEGWTEI